VIFRLRLDGEPGFDYMSPAIERITGYPPEAFYADPKFALKHMHPDDAGFVLGLDNEEHADPSLMRWTHRDGHLVWLERRTTYVRDAAGKLVAAEGIVRDVTERVASEERRRSLEQQLHRAQKLQAVGQLAGGIAHDFNNLLLAVRGYGELASRRLERGDIAALAGDVEGILDAAQRATVLTTQLLAFSRTQIMTPEVLDLNVVVEEMERLLLRLIGDEVELVTLFAAEPVLAEVDRSQLDQVIANLALNGRDAMPEGGRLAIQVKTVGRDAVLSIEDEGIGMDAETVARIFEPFFSTKGEQGTGLGLATVDRIVTQSGGYSVVDSVPGRGTTFEVHLPLSSGVPESAATPVPTAPGGAETILLVDDDPAVRSIVCQMLEDRGYEVVTAESGEHALEVVSRHSGPIALVLSDLVMRGLSGRQTAEGVREVHPHAKVLFMSGYSDDAVLGNGGLEPGTGFIQKPFSNDELAGRVRELLDLWPSAGT
jgi:PAS domain S-box-containing protein